MGQPEPRLSDLALECYREDPRGAFHVGWKSIPYERVDARHLRVGDRILAWHTPGWDVITRISSRVVRIINESTGKPTKRTLIRLHFRFYDVFDETDQFTAYKRITAETSNWG